VLCDEKVAEEKDWNGTLCPHFTFIRIKYIGHCKGREKMRNEILEGLEFDQEIGELSFRGVRYMLIRPETIIGFQKRAEELFEKNSDDLFYQSGFNAGRLSTIRYRDIFHLSDEESIRFMTKMGREIGWGRFILVEMNLHKKRMIFDVFNSPYAVAYGKSKKPVCHFTRGVLGGKGEVIFGQPVTSVEVRCQAMGDENCRFIIQGQKSSS
jgi:predicted hydrocarbon binding protein